MADKPKLGPLKYRACVDDLIVHNGATQKVYRVIAHTLGGENQDGTTELESVGQEPSDFPIQIPHIMFDEMVDKGIIECVWRLRGVNDGTR